MLFCKSQSMKIAVSPEQEDQLSSKEKISVNINENNIVAFDIYAGQTLIGFAMLRKFDVGCYFLWNFAIDKHFQNQHYGTRALQELLLMMKTEYGMHTMTTTYKFGNEHAKHLYEKAGFVETDIVDEADCHEVNMIYHQK